MRSLNTKGESEDERSDGGNADHYDSWEETRGSWNSVFRVAEEVPMIWLMSLPETRNRWDFNVLLLTTLTTINFGTGVVQWPRTRIGVDGAVFGPLVYLSRTFQALLNQVPISASFPHRVEHTAHRDQWWWSKASSVSISTISRSLMWVPLGIALLS